MAFFRKKAAKTEAQNLLDRNSTHNWEETRMRSKTKCEKHQLDYHRLLLQATLTLGWVILGINAWIISNT